MPNIQQLLNEEIRRLARKEVINSEKALKAQIQELKKVVSDLKNRIKVLEKSAVAPVAATVESNIEESTDSSKNFRITPERIIKWRKALNLKRAQYARLLGVSPLSVAHWEQGKSTPRAAQKQRIAELRDMGKRELVKLCAEKNIKLKVALQDSDND